MIKRITVFRAKPGLTREDVRAWWATHSDMAKGLPGLRGYTRNLVLKRLVGDAQLSGIIELWWDDEKTMQRAFATPLSTALREDAARCIEHQDSYLVEEMVTILLGRGR